MAKNAKAKNAESVAAAEAAKAANPKPVDDLSINWFLWSIRNTLIT